MRAFIRGISASALGAIEVSLSWQALCIVAFLVVTIGNPFEAQAQLSSFEAAGRVGMLTEPETAGPGDRMGAFIGVEADILLSFWQVEYFRLGGRIEGGSITASKRDGIATLNMGSFDTRMIATVGAQYPWYFEHGSLSLGVYLEPELRIVTLSTQTKALVGTTTSYLYFMGVGGCVRFEFWQWFLRIDAGPVIAVSAHEPLAASMGASVGYRFSLIR